MTAVCGHQTVLKLLWDDGVKGLSTEINAASFLQYAAFHSRVLSVIGKCA